MIEDFNGLGLRRVKGGAHKQATVLLSYLERGDKEPFSFTIAVREWDLPGL